LAEVIMSGATRTVAFLLFTLALMIGSAASPAPSNASPDGGVVGGYALLPPRILHWPQPPVGDDIHLPNSLRETSGPASPLETITMVRLFGTAAVSAQERAVATAACEAMNLAFLGAGQRDFLKEAIYSNVDEGEFNAGPFAEAGINSAIERAASAISAARYGDGLLKFYLGTCYQPKLG
jgi:hypothetical protein